MYALRFAVPDSDIFHCHKKNPDIFEDENSSSSLILNLNFEQRERLLIANSTPGCLRNSALRYFPSSQTSTDRLLRPNWLEL